MISFFYAWFPVPSIYLVCTYDVSTTARSPSDPCLNELACLSLRDSRIA